MADGLVRVIDRGLGDREQKALLAADALQSLDQLALDRFSARVRILCTTSSSRSTSPSVISAVRGQHSTASNVSRTGPGIDRRSDGYAAAPRARHAAISRSEQYANRSAGAPSESRRSSLAISSRIVLRPGRPGSPFSSARTRPGQR